MGSSGGALGSDCSPRLWVSSLIVAAFVGGGCGSSGSRDSPSGAVRLTLTQAPSDVACLEVTATGVRRVIGRFKVVPLDTQTFEMSALPLGDVLFSATAFGEPCDAAGALPPTWVSDSVSATIAKGVVASVALTMRRNGRASVSVDFAEGDAGSAEDAADGSTGDAADGSAGDAGGGGVGGAPGTGGAGTGGIGGSADAGISVDASPGSDAACTGSSGYEIFNCSTPGRPLSCSACLRAFPAAAGGSCACLTGAANASCVKLVECMSAGYFRCAFTLAEDCFCSPGNCPQGANGPCASLMEAVAGSTDPTVILAQLRDQTTLLGQLGVVTHHFAAVETCAKYCTCLPTQ